MIQPYLRVSGKQALAILLIQSGKERITTWASWKRLIPKCAIMAKATSRLRKGLQLNDPGSLTSYKQKKQSKCGWLFRKGEWVFHARVPVEAQWWKKTELLHQRAQSNGGKVECHIERCKGTRFHTLSVQWKGIISPMLQEAESPPTLKRKTEIMFTPSCTLKSTLWRKALLLLEALVKKTSIAAQAATKNSTTAEMKMSAGESCIRK